MVIVKYIYKYTNGTNYRNLSRDYPYTNTNGTVGIRIFVILCRIRIFVCIRILVYLFVMFDKNILM